MGDRGFRWVSENPTGFSPPRTQEWVLQETERELGAHGFQVGLLQ